MSFTEWVNQFVKPVFDDIHVDNNADDREGVRERRGEVVGT